MSKALLGETKTEAVLECRHVVKTFSEGGLNVGVLQDVSFSVAQGERVAIVGASGSGKSQRGRTRTPAQSHAGFCISVSSLAA
jgi:ABC-type glutathione transport system ATPase component